MFTVRVVTSSTLDCNSSSDDTARDLVNRGESIVLAEIISVMNRCYKERAVSSKSADGG